MAASSRIPKVSPAANMRRERKLLAESAWRLLPRNPTILGQLPTKSPKCRRKTANWQGKQVCALSANQNASPEVIVKKWLTVSLGRAVEHGSRGRDSTRSNQFPVWYAYRLCFVGVTWQWA